MLGLFFLGFVFLFLDFGKLMFISFASCGAFCVFIKNESNGELVFPKDNFTEKVSVCHINLSNVGHGEDMIRLLTESDLDIISFQEMTPEWSAYLLQALDKIFPFTYQAVRIDPYGKALFSKFPLHIVDTLSASYAFDLAIEMKKNGNTYTLISTYLTPSLNEGSLTMAKTQMKNISQFIQGTKKNVIVLGEFNMVYWSDEIRNFREATHLRNSRKDVIPASLRIPYDHIFYSSDLQCVVVKDLFVSRKERIGILTSFQQNLDLGKRKILLN
ncbi:MAG: endonuclease/exonuclease/phosphatase family protein [Saprospiraceae bacterium]|nr:endonuclease/exonuclease/phosphatase family protein [Saprospiraceae bacterium]